jgi:hypothetical protein
MTTGSLRSAFLHSLRLLAFFSRSLVFSRLVIPAKAGIHLDLRSALALSASLVVFLARHSRESGNPF